MATPEKVDLFSGPCDGARVVPEGFLTPVRYTVVESSTGGYVKVTSVGEFIAWYREKGDGLYVFTRRRPR